MTFSLDPDVLEAISTITVEGPSPLEAARGDWKMIRAAADPGMAAFDVSLPAHDSVIRKDFRVPTFDGVEVLARWYTTQVRPTTYGPAAVYIHGGGMIMGSVQTFDHYVAGYVAQSGVPMLSVDYRLAPEHPHPAPVEDCYSALGWIFTHSEQLGIDPARVAVMGDSAGGGLAAAAALLTRERGASLAKQILIYPMLDDRTTTPDPELAPFAFWTYDNNYTGWQALLGNSIGASDVPASAAPARAQDLSNLPSAYIEVGELDIFRNECIDYAQRLSLAGTSVELHVHPGCPHGFDRIAAAAQVVSRARSDRIRVLRSL